MQIERNAQEQRRAQLSAMEEDEDKQNELIKDEGRWIEKYRRRKKAFLGSLRDPENTADYLETLEIRYEDLFQAHEYLQETYTQLIRLETRFQHDVDEFIKAKRDKAHDFDHQTNLHQETQRAVLDTIRHIRKEAQEAELRRQRLQDEVELTRERQAQAQAAAQGGRQARDELPSLHNNGSHSNPVGNLKRVDLPKFDGKLKDYFRWKSTFDVLVKNNE